MEEILDIESVKSGESTEPQTPPVAVPRSVKATPLALVDPAGRGDASGHIPIEGPEEREGLEPGTRWGPVIRRCSSCCMRL